MDRAAAHARLCSMSDDEDLGPNGRVLLEQLIHGKEVVLFEDSMLSPVCIRLACRVLASSWCETIQLK